jgi:hypothetical protein
LEAAPGVAAVGAAGALEPPHRGGCGRARSGRGDGAFGDGLVERFELSAVGYNLLGWHFALGVVLTLAVAVHAGLRAKPIRRRDLAGRRQFLAAGAVAAGSYLAWLAQRPVAG